jgi:glycosidase
MATGSATSGASAAACHTCGTSAWTPCGSPELGLWEVEDLPDLALRDPTWERSGHRDRGRDGCRVPLPWSGAAPPFGFGPPGSVPWLPQPAGWGAVSVAAETGDPASMLELYRRALHLRREHPGLAGESLRWLPSPAGTLVFEREAGFRCAVNLGSEPLLLPDEWRSSWPAPRSSAAGSRWTPPPGSPRRPRGHGDRSRPGRPRW